MSDPDDFEQMEGEAREGAVVAVITIIGFLSFVSGVCAGWIGRGILG